jgi:UDP-N-acetylglucosamine--N-acetylmuramyl-(pentapeptide) pyrophosphoryl-undecaprenol N-acetylglucosamine transferase
VTGCVLIAGGGTGGHVFPSLATAAAIRAARPELDVEFVGTTRGLEARLVPEHGWTLHKVETLPLARRLSPQTLRVPVTLARASGEVARLIRNRGVVVTLCFGGYVSVPLALAARRTHVPLVFHEQNAVAGLANRLASRWATAAALSMDTKEVRAELAIAPDRVTVTGNPVRPGLGQVDRALLRREAHAEFDLDPRRRTLLVFGGSQGAHRINQAVVGSVRRLAEPESLQILHATGRAAYDVVSGEWEAALHGEGLRVRCQGFIDRMDLAYAAADLVLCRAGASSIAELTVMGLPSILVPYPHATADHQTANARALQRAGASVMIPDGQLDAAELAKTVNSLFADSETLARMSAASRALGRPDAADALARVVLSCVVDSHGRGHRRPPTQGDTEATP